MWALLPSKLQSNSAAFLDCSSRNIKGSSTGQGTCGRQSVGNTADSLQTSSKLPGDVNGLESPCTAGMDGVQSRSSLVLSA